MMAGHVCRGRSQDRARNQAQDLGYGVHPARGARVRAHCGADRPDDRRARSDAPGGNRASKEIAETLGQYPALGRQAAEAIPNGNAGRVPRTGHSPQVEAPEPFHAKLLEVLGQAASDVGCKDRKQARRTPCPRDAVHRPAVRTERQTARLRAADGIQDGGRAQGRAERDAARTVGVVALNRRSTPIPGRSLRMRSFLPATVSCLWNSQRAEEDRSGSETSGSLPPPFASVFFKSGDRNLASLVLPAPGARSASPSSTVDGWIRRMRLPCEQSHWNSRRTS